LTVKSVSGNTLRNSEAIQALFFRAFLLVDGNTRKHRADSSGEAYRRIGMSKNELIAARQDAESSATAWFAVLERARTVGDFDRAAGKETKNEKSERKTRIPTRSRRNRGITSDIRRVLLAGAVGGLMSWVYAKMSGLSIGQPVYYALPGYALLGAVAAGLGVYLLASTVRSARERRLFFAILCGIAWKPVFDGGHALIEKIFRDRENQHLSRDIDCGSELTIKFHLQSNQREIDENAKKTSDSPDD
jgi:hypothetical protein